MKHSRTLDERKEVERRSKQRKAERRSDSPRKKGARGGAGGRDWCDEEDRFDEFESIPASPRFRASRASNPLGVAIAGGPADSPPQPEDSTHLAVVVSCAPGRARILQAGVERDAALSEEIARTQKTSLAVGDEVLLEEREGALPRVRAVLERRTRISRPDPSRPDVERVLVANVDRAVIVVSVRRPSFRPRLIDRYLIAVQHGGVEPIVCANKADLVGSLQERRELDELLVPYREIGVPTLLTSGTTDEGVSELRDLLEGRMVVFLGQSGVGKSSLLNALAPELDLVIGCVREGDGKGRHTTTTSRLVDLGNGTRWIDTPGIRSFGLSDVTRASLPSYFPELVELRGQCRFGDCTHIHEPACAVLESLQAGHLSRRRYETYVRILETL